MYEEVAKELSTKMELRIKQCEPLTIERHEVEHFLNELLRLFFPSMHAHRAPLSIYEIHNELQKIAHLLAEIIYPLLDKDAAKTEEIIRNFMAKVPEIYDYIWLDAEAAYNGDPAAESLAEVILAYPGFFAICVHRIAHALYKLQVPIFPRILSEYAHERTGIDIHPGAAIGQSFFMDHGTGIVIGETTIIGNHVKLYQGVTLGALSVSKDMAQKKRHPTIEDYVVIYAGATILGGNTVVGHHSIIGGNVWLTESVPPYSVVYNKTGIKIRNHRDLENVIDFSI
ncbi:MAG: serine acetyltransferase [Leptospiraceae bacterium]|nr:serine acetyltransferase [Leptospiraceae bacterium]MDW8306391.1 serine O-acetyltransferase EpsC [Leptospiraceae bacterium]